MTIAINELNGMPPVKSEVARYPTFEDARCAAFERFDAAHFEVDRDFDNCADFITHSGRVLSIEPVGFAL